MGHKMKIRNIFQMNDWPIKKFIILAAFLQISVWGLIGLDTIGFQIPILRQLICFIYLTIIPGFSVLRILKIHNLSNIQALTYAIGLSITFVMFLGFSINILYPKFGIQNPISVVSLVVTISIILIILVFLSYIRDKDFANQSALEIKDISSSIVLFLILLPLLSILGSQMVNFYQNNVILLFLIPLLAIVPFFVLLKSYPEELYPATIFSVSLTLIYHTSLISPYIWGWDNNFEYYFANLVLLNSKWASSFASNINSMLSIVMLWPIYSLILNTDLASAQKVIYTFLFCFTPLVLYQVYNFFGKRNAFLSCFFFVAYSFFYINAPTGGRQEIAELFLSLIILSLFSDNLMRFKKSLLLITFLVSLAVSHYGLTYIWIFLFIISWVSIKLIEGRKAEKIHTMSSTLVLIFLVFSLTWYIHTSSTSNFITIIKIAEGLASTMLADFFEAESSQGVSIVISSRYSYMVTLELFMQIIALIFIVIGVLSLIFSREYKKYKLPSLLHIFIILNLGVCAACLIVPHFASKLNVWRFYHISLIILAPAVLIGGQRFFEFLLQKIYKNYSMNAPLKLMCMFLAIFLLFNTSWVYSIGGQYPYSIRSISLHQDALENGADMGKNAFYSGFYTDYDIYCVKWLSEERDEKIKIFADFAKKNLLLTSYGMMPGQHIMTNRTLWDNSYLYLCYPNIKFDLMHGGKDYWHLSECSSSLDEADLLYNNGYSQTLLGRQ